MKMSVRLDENVRSFGWKRAFVFACLYTRVREIYMVSFFDLLILNLENCYSLFFCLSGICELIPENVSKKFRGMLAGFRKVCTFATAFERETH